jgi:hypothetical protein
MVGPTSWVEKKKKRRKGEKRSPHKNAYLYYEHEVKFGKMFIFIPRNV